MLRGFYWAQGGQFINQSLQGAGGNPGDPDRLHYRHRVGTSGQFGGIDGKYVSNIPLHIIGSPIIMELCYSLWFRQVAFESCDMVTQLMTESGPTVCEEILFPFWSKWADG